MAAGREVREYVEALRGRLDGLDSKTRARLLEWCEWAEDWARRADPLMDPAHLEGMVAAENESDPLPRSR